MHFAVATVAKRQGSRLSNARNERENEAKETKQRKRKAEE